MGFSRPRVRGDGGFILVDLLLSVIILGILAAVVLTNATEFNRTKKIGAFSADLAALQKASDSFHTATGLYPTYGGASGGNQPVAGAAAAQISLTAQDASHLAFYPAYLRVAPDTVATDYHVDATLGATLYYGVTGTGKVFATQTPPVNGQWTSGTAVIYIQESVKNTTAAGRPGTTTLSAIW